VALRGAGSCAIPTRSLRLPWGITTSFGSFAPPAPTALHRGSGFVPCQNAAAGRHRGQGPLLADTGPQLRRGRWAAMDQLADSRRTAAGRQQPTHNGLTGLPVRLFRFRNARGCAGGFRDLARKACSVGRRSDDYLGSYRRESGRFSAAKQSEARVAVFHGPDRGTDVSWGESRRPVSGRNSAKAADPIDRRRIASWRPPRRIVEPLHIRRVHVSASNDARVGYFPSLEITPQDVGGRLTE